MAKVNNDFSESLKVDLSKTNTEKTPISDRDLYFLSNLMRDTNRIKNFLLSVYDNYNISAGEATNYYYSINHQLAEAEFGVRKGEIDGTQLADQLNAICEGHQIDFNHLMATTDKLDSLKKTPNQDEMIAFAQELEERVMEDLSKKNDRQQ